jgi:hypothetical protein
MTLSKGLTELGDVGDVEPGRELLPGVNVIKLFSLILGPYSQNIFSL